MKDAPVSEAPIWVIWKPTWLARKLELADERGWLGLREHGVAARIRKALPPSGDPLCPSAREVPRAGLLDRPRRALLHLRVLVARDESEAQALVSRLHRTPFLVRRGSIETLAELSGAQAQEPKDLTEGQAYLGGTEHGGIDSYAAWSVGGGRGDGVPVYLFELGIEGHVEFDRQPGEREITNLGPFGDPDAREHGVRSLGVLAAKCSLSGICHEASFEVVEVKPPEVSLPKTNLFERITELAGSASKGTVFVLPLNGSKQLLGPKLPIEAWRCGRTAISYAVARGIHVVQSAGNGDVDLDRELSKLADSGSIVVGAGYPHAPVSRGWNHGRRVDLHAWGQDVLTCTPSGYAEFNATSAAACIVAGVVVCLSGIERHHRDLAGFSSRPFGPRALRRLLRSTGYWSIPGLGSRPSLRDAISRIVGGKCRLVSNRSGGPPVRPCVGLRRSRHALKPTPPPTPSTPPGSDP